MEVWNATRRLGDGSHLILRQRVGGSARAVRAVRNTRVFQTETTVVADDNFHILFAVVNFSILYYTIMSQYTENILQLYSISCYPESD